MDSTQLASLEIEGIMEAFPELTKSVYKLDSRFTSVRAKRVGTKAFRLPMKYSKPEDAYGLDLNNGVLSAGDNSKWTNGSITPFVYAVSTNWTKLVELVGVNKDAVAIKNVVEENMADLAKQIRNWRNKLLHTGGKGTLGVVSAINTGTKTITLTGGFGSRLVGTGLTVEIVDPATDLKRASVPISQVNNALGGTQTFTYTGADPGGTVAGDLVRFRGLVDGAPIATYGLPYFINNSTIGTLLGITKNQAPYVVSNSLDAGGGQLTQPMVEALINIIQARLDDDPMAGGFWHWHRSQKSSYQELGFNLMTIPMAGGTAPSELDLFFGGSGNSDTFKMAGYMTQIDDHADNTAVYFVQPDGWGKVTYGDGPFWYEVPGGSKIYQVYDSATGMPKMQYGATMIDPTQFFCDNVCSQGVLTNLGLPAFQ